MHIPFDLAVPLLEICLTFVLTQKHKDLCTKVSTAALSIVTKDWTRLNVKKEQVYMVMDIN